MAELRQYRYFVEVARRGSFTAASRTLHLTQSALSAQIMQLERDVGVTLFDRGRHGARLTSAGDLLFDQAEELLRAAAEIELSARRLKAPARSPLQLGVTMGPLLWWLPEVLVEFEAARGDIDVFVEDIVTAEIFLRLGTGQLDLGIVSVNSTSSEAVFGAGLEAQRLIEDDFVLLVADDHPFAAEASVPLSALRDERLIAFPRSFSLRTLIDELLERAHVPTRPVMETGWIEIMLHSVALGRGIAFVPRSVTLLIGERPITTVALSDSDSPRRVLTALHRADSPRHAAIAQLLEMAAARVTEFAGPGGWPSSLPTLSNVASPSEPTAGG